MRGFAILWAMLVVGLFACAPQPSLAVTRLATESPAAKIWLMEVDGDILKFMVQNLTPEPMLILRDEIVLHTSHGVQRRLPGGLSSTYNVPPFGAHDVNVRFDVSMLQPGEQAEVHFSRAPSALRAPDRDRTHFGGAALSARASASVGSARGAHHETLAPAGSREVSSGVLRGRHVEK